MPNPVSTALLVVHVVAGTAAVVAGAAALLVPKVRATTASPGAVAATTAHRRGGRAFLHCIAVVIATATLMTTIEFNPYFAGLTAAAAIAAFSGWRVLGRKRPDVDPRQRATPLDWAVTLLLLAVAILLLALAIGGRITRNLPVVYALGGGTSAYALYDLYRFVRPTAFPFSPDLWLYEHLVKMLGAYFGAVAAFSGSVLVMLDPPWRQLWATTTGQLLSVILVLYYRRSLARRRQQHHRAVHAETAGAPAPGA
jgi:hypothetical protein